jgi:hypothetical protein
MEYKSQRVKMRGQQYCFKPLLQTLERQDIVQIFGLVKNYCLDPEPEPKPEPEPEPKMEPEPETKLFQSWN